VALGSASSWAPRRHNWVTLTVRILRWGNVGAAGLPATLKVLGECLEHWRSQAARPRPFCWTIPRRDRCRQQAPNAWPTHFHLACDAVNAVTSGVKPADLVPACNTTSPSNGLFLLSHAGRWQRCPRRWPVVFGGLSHRHVLDSAPTFGVCTGAIADDDFHARVLAQPVGEDIGSAVVEKVDWTVRLEVHQQRAVAALFASQGHVVDAKHTWTALDIRNIPAAVLIGESDLEVR
jgi:hypothetical protein